MSAVAIDVATNSLVLFPVFMAWYSERVESVTGYVISLITGIIWIAFAFLKENGTLPLGKLINIAGLIILIYFWYSFDNHEADYPNSYEINTKPESCVAKYVPRQYRGNNVCFVIKNGSGSSN